MAAATSSSVHIRFATATITEAMEAAGLAVWSESYISVKWVTEKESHEYPVSIQRRHQKKIITH